MSKLLVSTIVEIILSLQTCNFIAANRAIYNSRNYTQSLDTSGKKQAIVDLQQQKLYLVFRRVCVVFFQILIYNSRNYTQSLDLQNIVRFLELIYNSRNYTQSLDGFVGLFLKYLQQQKLYLVFRQLKHVDDLDNLQQQKLYLVFRHQQLFHKT